MGSELLNTTEAAKELGISRARFYHWLAQSNAGQLRIRGQPVTVDYLQGGANGQGRIRIEMRELDRIKQLMRVQPNPPRRRRPTKSRDRFPGITVKLGRPAE